MSVFFINIRFKKSKILKKYRINTWTITITSKLKIKLSVQPVNSKITNNVFKPINRYYINLYIFIEWLTKQIATIRKSKIIVIIKNRLYEVLQFIILWKIFQSQPARSYLKNHIGIRPHKAIIYLKNKT